MQLIYGTILVAFATTVYSAVVPRQASTPIPASCPGVPAARYPSTVASGWRAVKIAGNMRAPRGVVIDSAGHLLVVETGKGITVHTLADTGCIASSKTLITSTALNHGIALSLDSKTIYASSPTSVWKWTYDPVSATVSGSNTVVVSGMYNAGHTTRTLAIPKNNGNLLVVSHGSNGNLDMPTQNVATQRAVVKVFNLANLPSGGYNYVSGGWQAGYGLRNEVGIVFDGNNMLWGVENSSDDMKRTVNGQSVDIHTDNPAEELNFLGDVSVANNKWYGYPTCFTVWNPAVITDKRFAIGDQLVLSPNASFNDDTCKTQSTPPRLSFQAHSAPLDAQFNANFTSLYVSFHGSWNRQAPTGFKLVEVPFAKGTDGSYNPVAAATSGSGYNDIWKNAQENGCGFSACFRPVGIAVQGTRIFVTSDAGAEGELFVLGRTT